MNLLYLLASGSGSGSGEVGQKIIDTAYKKFLNIINIIMPVLICIFNYPWYPIR